MQHWSFGDSMVIINHTYVFGRAVYVLGCTADFDRGFLVTFQPDGNGRRKSIEIFAPLRTHTQHTHTRNLIIVSKAQDQQDWQDEQRQRNVASAQESLGRVER
jgi:hypothetical protein